MLKAFCTTYFLSIIYIRSVFARTIFSETWSRIREPHRSTAFSQLNDRQRKENLIVPKIRVRVEWAYAMIKMHWKLTMKFLQFKLDQNNDLALQQMRVTHLISNFRACCRGNCVRDIVCFNMMPPNIEEHLSNIN